MQVYLVGGAVRDKLLGYPTDEYDYVVVGATPEQMQKQGFTPVGKDFPVFLHPESKDEYALARTERKTGRGYQGFSFNADPDVTLEQDLNRRDLTINAIAELPNGELVDPFNGQQDIQDKCLRHVSNAFREDPVRILRIARFAARYHHLGFYVAQETYVLMQEMVNNGEAHYLVSERVWKEFSRALNERSPHIFLEVLQQCGALKIVLPEIHSTLEASQEGLKLLALACKNHYRQNKAKNTIRMAALLYTMDKQNADQQEKDKQINKLSLPQLDSLCKRLTLPNEYKELCKLVITFQNTFNNANILDAEETLALLTQTDALRRPERFHDFMEVCELALKNQHKKTQEQKALLTNALTCINSVSPQELLAQGFTGKQLGDAIKAKRIEELIKLFKK